MENPKIDEYEKGIESARNDIQMRNFQTGAESARNDIQMKNESALRSLMENQQVSEHGEEVPNESETITQVGKCKNRKA